MTHFTLIGRPALIFRVVERGLYSGVDCVVGCTLDWTLVMIARIVDVVEADPNSSEE